MVFQLDSGIYDRAARTRLSDRMMGQRERQAEIDNQTSKRKIDLSERLMGLREKKANDDALYNDTRMDLANEKIKASQAQRAAKYLGMATRENWPSIRQQAISEGLGSEETIPAQYDDNWIQSARKAYGLEDDMPAAVKTMNWLQDQSSETQEKFSGLFGKSDRTSAMQEKINLLVASGVDPEKAVGIATGRIATSRDPLTGNVTLIDKGTNQVVPIIEGAAPSGTSTGAGLPNEPAALDDASTNRQKKSANKPTGLFSILNKATGIESEAVNLGSNVLGQLDSSFVNNPTVRARAEFDLFKKPLQRAMSVNPERPLKFDLEQTEQLFSGAGMTAPGVMQEKLKALRDNIQFQLDNSRENARDNTLPKKFRQDEASRVKLLEQSLKILGRPQQMQTQGSGEFEGFSIVE